MPIAVCLVTFSFTGSAQLSPATPTATTRTRISERIDSLDLTKQNLKRQGLAIADIEQKQEILRDSLNYLRTHLEPTPKTASRPATEILLSKFLKKPSNLFDWIIVITGIVALFSGVMLFIGVTRVFSGKKRPIRRNQDTLKVTNVAEAEKKIIKPASAYPEKLSEPSSTPPPATPTTTDIGSVTQLRRRIEKHQITPGMYDTPHIPELPPVAEPSSSDKDHNEQSIERLVVAAARNGLDIPAISRKFQLSSDHVALILKMAGKRPHSR